MKKVNLLLFWICCFGLVNNVSAQDKLYPNTFPLSDVKLSEGPFQHARDLNIQALLQYDVDRLLAPYLKEAGLPEKAQGYPNWEGLDGHIGGHYLTAMAMNYAATGNAECKKRMDYMVEELLRCQIANTQKYPDWGKGYVGGVPKGEGLWPSIKKGEIQPIWQYWVPWYNVHKTYAGLRDAWLYANNKQAGTIFLDFCDWAVDLTAGLTDAQMEQMLGNEHGGMNEIFADAYQMTGDNKYLATAMRFSHKELLDAMAVGHDNLDNKHANTQVPKAIGFQRIAELSKDDKYARAGQFFWETVSSNRSLALGGNSRREHFPAESACEDFIHEVEGPETCNTYNMMKLTEDLFRVDPSARYADFYERAMYNHILSSQHPHHGGYVYFTPMRPRHYRVYSAPNEAMWCCVGSGMENHAKYNQFVYTHQNDTLFVNLFVASELHWKEKGLKIKQETLFPNEEQTKLTITEGSSDLTLLVRYPYWVKDGALEVKINGKTAKYNKTASSYIALSRKWKKGDEVQILLPMHLRIEQLTNVPNYIAIMYGPVLLGAKTGTEDLRGLIANDSRWGHIASGNRLPIDQAPIIIEDSHQAILSKLQPVGGKSLAFTTSDLKMINPIDLVLEPFYDIHDSRYMLYWMALSDKQYQSYIDSLAMDEKKKLELQSRTIDFVVPGEQQPEADHDMQMARSRSGNNHNQFYREASNEGFFSYKLSTNKETGLSLIVRYWGAEWGDRKFDIYVDDEHFMTVDNTGKWNQSRFQEEEYKIPERLLEGKDNIRVKFQALPGNTAGAIYHIRLVRPQSSGGSH